MAIQQSHPNPPMELAPDKAQALKVHNEAREAATRKSSVPRPSLIWDDGLAAAAELWAQHLALADAGLNHSTNEQRPEQGENLFWMSAGGNLGDASKGWVNEGKVYHGEKVGEGDFGSYGHYTQVIWPGTIKVGLALAKSSNGGNFMVGRYSPPGNFTGRSAFTGK